MLPPRGVSVGEILTGVLAGSEVSCGWTFNMWRAVLRTKERRRGPCSCFSCSVSACFFPNHSTQLNFYLSLYSLLLWSPDCYQRERLLNSTHQWNGTTWGAAITYQRGFRCLAELGKESGVGGWNSLNKNLHVDSLRADFVPQVQDYFEQSMQNSWIKIHSKSSFQAMKSFYLALDIC